MGYYDSRDGVAEYIETAEGFDGRELVDVLKTYLKDGSTVLELGMGPGRTWKYWGSLFRSPARTNQRCSSRGIGKITPAQTWCTWTQ